MQSRVKNFVKIGSGFLLVGLMSCVTRGQDFSSDLKWIKAKQTTKTEVSQRLGEPFQIGSSSGQETWTYGRYNYKLFGEAKTKELKFYFTPDGKVDSYSFNSSYPEDKKSSAQPVSH